MWLAFVGRGRSQKLEKKNMCTGKSFLSTYCRTNVGQGSMAVEPKLYNGGRGQMAKGLDFILQCECYLVSHRRFVNVLNREGTKSALDLKNISQ